MSEWRGKEEHPDSPESRTVVHVLFQGLLDRIPWLSGLKRLVPARWEAWLFPLLLLALVAYFREDIRGVLKEWHGPDIIITALPERARLAEFGAKDLLYEFRVKREAAAKPVQAEDDLRRLFETERPIALASFSCGTEPATGGYDLYKLSIISQNLGSQTARDYSVMISFSGDRETDSGVRMLHLESDELKVCYLYLQRPDVPVPSCLNKPAAATDSEPAQPAAERYPLVRDTYRSLGLTRDVAILSGSLEARMFQTIDIIAAVPKGVRTFAVLYQVDCSNCRWFYRTTSYGQILRTP